MWAGLTAKLAPRSLAGEPGANDVGYPGSAPLLRVECRPAALAVLYAATSRSRVISEGAPKRSGGPQ
jgi:hypothetical protein